MDALAQRYGLLPSEVLNKATTFDLEILDITRSFEIMKTNKSHGVTPAINQDVMLKALKKVRGE